ncbi:MAG: CvpA family protein [Phycisphaerales bacterium]|nr:CvpA family protein [Phycisphaerales bacterium]MCB9857235.1 CvpA family protein [Phycisphaerales bacterium]MCB9863051.1 CvpA family protein [Phycisphaerales bacterium]
MYLLRGQKKPPVIAEPKAFSPPAGPSTPNRGREMDFSIDRDAPVKGPWLMAGLLLAATAATFGMSLNSDYLLGEIASPIIGLMTLHGLFKGGFRKAIMLPITIAGVGFLMTNPMIFDPIVQRVTGGPSPFGNYVACAVAITLGLWIVGIPVKAIRKKVIMKRPVLRGTDRFFGTGIGFAEGALMALLVMWGAVLIEPQAKQVATNANAKPVQRQFASGVLSLIAEIDKSPLAPIVRDANLLEEFPQLTKPLEALRADGTVDPSKLDPQQLEGLIDMLESVGGEQGSAVAEQLRTVERNREAQAEAYESLPKPSH